MSAILEELKQELVSAGWRISRALDSKFNICTWYAWLPRTERVTEVYCECNDKPPSLCIIPSLIHVSDSKEAGASTFRLCGEVKGGLWVDLNVYSVDLKDTMKTIEPAKKILFAAWEAAHKASEVAN